MSSGWAPFVSFRSVNSSADSIVCQLLGEAMEKSGSISGPLAFCLNSSWLCLAPQFRMEARWGRESRKGEKQSMY